MAACEIIRQVLAGPYRVRFRVAADTDFPEDEESRADALVELVGTIAADVEATDTDPVAVASRIASLLAGITEVEVIDDHGVGAVVYP